MDLFIEFFCVIIINPLYVPRPARVFSEERIWDGPLMVRMVTMVRHGKAMRFVNQLQRACYITLLFFTVIEKVQIKDIGIDVVNHLSSFFHSRIRASSIT